MHATPPAERRRLRAGIRGARLARALVVPLALALPPLFWVVEATTRASRTTLGRDQGIFQYIAWAIGEGDRDYRDIRDVNGPLTPLIHCALLALGGADEHRFRVLDLAVTGATYALVGACVPGLAAPGPRRAPAAIERVAWAFAGWVVLSGQYLLYGYWDLAQRESFFDWFMLPSVALQLVAQAPGSGAGWPRRRARLMVVVGALSVVPWFGKPTYALFTVVQLAAIALGDPGDAALFARSGGKLRAPPHSPARGFFPPSFAPFAAFALGGALAAATQVAFLIAHGDAIAYARIQLVDVPAMYRFIWPRAPADLFSDPWRATQAIFALTGATVLIALVWLGEMPRRVFAVALAPVCALVSVAMQAKGFPYHFHPVTAAVHLQWLVFVAWLAERTRVAQGRLAIVRLAPLAVGAAFALRIATALEDSPYVRGVWLLWGARTPEERSTREYFARFPEPDFFPFEMRQTADYLRRHTGPDDRVQAYGLDAYLLFLAGRRSATPYIYAYDLNADAALAGGTGGHPDDAEAARIRSMRDDHERDMLARLEARPPAAFVFMDGAPLLSVADAWDDFVEHCDRTAAWVRTRYRESARFGHDHVWLRRDRPSPAAESEPENLERESPDEETIPDAP